MAVPSSEVIGSYSIARAMVSVDREDKEPAPRSAVGVDHDDDDDDDENNEMPVPDSHGIGKTERTPTVPFIPSSIITTLGSPVADGNSWHIVDHFMGPHFAQELKQELDQQHGIFASLKPAKTQSEVETNNLLSMLQKSGFLVPSSDNEKPTTTALNEEETNHNHPETTTAAAAAAATVRGDKSQFISHLRQSPQFPKEFPCLHSLIQTIEATAHQYLSDSSSNSDLSSSKMEFDFSRTSIQLALFPGDGTSGYPRHCDRRGNLCQEEKTSNSSNNDNGSSNGKAERLITAIYYLTDDDWTPEADGGCLRLYMNGNRHTRQNNNNIKNNQNNNHSNYGNSYVDVAPYQNRLILFRSDGVEHEVRPSLRRPRVALTTWLYGRMKTITAAAATTTRSDEKSAAPVAAAIKEGREGENKNVNRELISGPPPLPIQHPRHRNEQDTIFVSIAAYRDSELGPTIRHLTAMATHPERVFVGLCLQLDPDEDEAISNALPTKDPWYNSNVRCIRLDARHAMGPCYARALCQSLFRGEQYVLQIDSHMRFRKHWDTYLIQQLEQLISSKNHEKVMLSAYPAGYRLPDSIPSETRGTLLVPWKFDANGLLRQRGRLMKPQAAPVPSLLYAAGFNFARSFVLQDCPYDESLHHLFFGEELSMAMRLYTKGYDLFAPSQSVCYHLVCFIMNLFCFVFSSKMTRKQSWLINQPHASNLYFLVEPGASPHTIIGRCKR